MVLVAAVVLSSPWISLTSAITVRRLNLPVPAELLSPSPERPGRAATACTWCSKSPGESTRQSSKASDQPFLPDPPAFSRQCSPSRVCAASRLFRQLPVLYCRRC